MPHYCVWATEGTEDYWVLAASDDEAKRLVALNIPSIGGDVTKLECVANSKFDPLYGVIITSGGRTFTVLKT